MNLPAGTRLGPYEILSPLGAGGMGDVYRARDTRLDRIVAIKVSREDFSDRFSREARAIAALNHPHICQLYDVGPNYLVMEFVEGAQLSGPLPTAQATSYALQICDALEAAHRAGIVHRDLKPSNILVGRGGVKLLDFGLAKQQLPGAGDADAFTRALTGAGTIVGTPQYMAPEQLQGREADARSDIFALGLILYEMRTGRRAFEGSNPASVMAAILERPAPSLEPEGLNRVVSACLEKNPDDRFQSARDVKRALEWSSSAGAVSTQPGSHRSPRRNWVPWAVALAALAFGGLGWAWPRAGTSTGESFLLSVAPAHASGITPVGTVVSRPTISPDGRMLTYTDAGGQLHVRPLDAVQVQDVGTGSVGSTTVIWSPDSRDLVTDNAGSLVRVRVSEGAPVVILKNRGAVLGGSWQPSGMLLYALVQSRVSLQLASVTGGEPRQIQLPGVGEGNYFFPEFLPDSDDFLVTFEKTGVDEADIYLATLRDGQATDPVLLTRNQTAASFTPAGGGRLLFVRNDTLYAQPLNRKTRHLEGEPEIVARNVASAPGFRMPYFSVSRTGVAVWRPGKAATGQLTTFDREGHVVGRTGPPSMILSVKLSPDGQRVLVGSQTDQWMAELNQSGTMSVSRDRDAMTTLWSPDGASFLVPRRPALFRRPVLGFDTKNQAQKVGETDGLDRLEDISPDGKTVLFTGGALATKVSAASLDGSSIRDVRPVLDTGEAVFNTRFSPDGRWIVYEAYPNVNQPGGLYVQPFPGPGLRRQIAGNAKYPTWRKDGAEIIVLNDGFLSTIPVRRAGQELRFGEVQHLFPVKSPNGVVDVNLLAVSPDGSRFYVPQPVDQPDSDVINVRAGWLK